MGVIIYSFNLNISPKMSYSVLECHITELHAYDFVIKNGTLKKSYYVGVGVLKVWFVDHKCG